MRTIITSGNRADSLKAVALWRFRRRQCGPRKLHREWAKYVTDGDTSTFLVLFIFAAIFRRLIFAVFVLASRFCSVVLFLYLP